MAKESRAGVRSGGTGKEPRPTLLILALTDLRPLQRAFLEAGAVKKAWRLYLQSEFGKATARQSQSLFAEVLQDLVSGMSDAAIKRMAAQLIQCDELTDPQRRQLAAIIRWRNKRR